MFKSNRATFNLFFSFSLIFWLLFSLDSLSQKQSTIDSLSKLLDKTTDSSRVVILKKLSWEYRNTDTSKSIAYGKNALEAAIKLNLYHEQSDILGRLGVYKRNQGDFSKAMDFYFRGLEIAQRNRFSDLEALEFNNIGDIYNRLGIYDQAIDYVNKALSISIRLMDNYNLSYIYHMRGLIYMNSSMFDSSLVSFRKSLEYRKKLKLQSGVASSYLNIGTVLFKKANYDSSFIYYNQALEIFKRMDDIVGTANVYKCLGEYYNQKGDFNGALENFKKSMILVKGFGIPQVNKEAAEGLIYTYSKLGDFKKALYFHEYATRIKDSISNNLYIQKITRLTENFKFEIKNKEQEVVQKQKEEILTDRIKYQRNQLRFAIAAFIMMVVFVGIIIFFYRDKNKAYNALNLKNNEIAELNKGLIEANREILVQKEEIESQRDILLKQSEDLTQLNFTKDKLFSIIGHDLRAPFNSIIGFSEVIKDDIKDSNFEDIEEMNNLINQAGITTLRTLENLLSWAKTQTKQVIIYKENINITKIISDNINDFYPQANLKKINILFNSSTEIEVFTDRNMFGTILRNLISNSVKYSNQGGTITITALKNGDHAEVSIQDNGIGMSQEIKNNLFKNNINLSTLGTSNEKGTGLGLSICIDFIKKLNGNIWVESEVNKGSTFRVKLPLRS